ncbi:MAG: ABC transporter permease [Actinomycetota bacterium]
MADTLTPTSGETPDDTAAVLAEAEQLGEKPESFGQQTWRKFRGHRLAVIGVLLLILLVVAFIFGPSLSDKQFDERDIANRAKGISTDAWFGTDDLGRDLFVRTMIGGRFSLQIALITAICATAVGALFGSLAGYFGGVVDGTVNFLVNLLLTIPVLAVLLVVSVRFEATTPVRVALLIVAFSWIRSTRVVRAQVLQLKEMEFVQAARAAGAGAPRIILRHILPNVAGALLVEATLIAGTAIILESTLSFLGFGVQPPEATLGTLIDDAKGSIDTRPSRVLIPGAIITMIVLSLNFIGDGLRDALDPKSRQER